MNEFENKIWQNLVDGQNGGIGIEIRQPQSALHRW
jgi:hypothetical protein